MIKCEYRDCTKNSTHTIIFGYGVYGNVCKEHLDISIDYMNKENYDYKIKELNYEWNNTSKVRRGIW